MTLSGASVPLLSLTDTIIAGHALPAGGLAALIVGTKIYEFAGLVFFFLSISTSLCVSRCLGQEDRNEARLWLFRSLLLALSISLIILPMLYFAAPSWATFLGADSAIIDPTLTYIKIRLLGLPALILMESMLGFLLGALAARAVMWISITMNLVNLCLNLFFVLGLDFDITGLAWGTVLAQWAACGLALLLLCRNDQGLLPALARITWAEVTGWHAIRQLLTANINLLARSVLVLAYLQGITYMAGELSITHLAAMGIVMTYIMGATFLQGGIARTTEVTTARLESTPAETTLAALKICTTWYLGAGVLLSLLYFVGSDRLIALITQNEQIQAMSATLWPYLVVYVACIPWVFLTNSLLLGIQRYCFLRNTYIASFTLFACAIYGLFLQAPSIERLWLCVLIFDSVRGGLMTYGVVKHLLLPALSRRRQSAHNTIVAHASR